MTMENEIIPEFTEAHWSMLIDDIVQGRVVPVLGPELLVAHDNKGKEIQFYQAVTQHLAQNFKMTEIENETLNDFLIRFIKETNKPEKEARTEITKFLENLERKEENQPTLEKLAEIKKFRLFLTMTPDSLMSKALEKKDNVEPEVFFFSTYGRPETRDLPKKKLDDYKRYVYHFYGKPSPGCEYVISEDNCLIHHSQKWMNHKYTPKRLLDYLKNKCLLFLGCGYENWLARFLIIGLQGEEVFFNRDFNSLLADTKVKNDSQLVRFLSRCGGNIYCGTGVDFVGELCKRLEECPIKLQETCNESFKQRSIFISYAHEDREAALRIKSKLEEYSLNVWIDEKRLKSGDAFDKKIPQYIPQSTLFLAIISQKMANDFEDRYYRKEWTIAADHAPKCSPIIPFIHPIAIDDLQPPCDNFIPAINTVTWMRAPDGNISVTDLTYLLELIKLKSQGSKHTS